ncbi:TetR/AcrR family transcriptional regulator [Paraburkholderia megapolitana]|uniref:TetR/AcrR family transcriptional regulator n=1 Tax=Paraburkholderia megapolitana TaxID=420953 RepID=UPI0038B999B0
MIIVMYNVKHQLKGWAMKISREQVAENRQRILDAASRMFRERGFEDVTVAEVMKAAGLTHGAFYGHFESKDDLIAQAFAHVLTPPADGSASRLPDDLKEFAAFYLRAAHRDDPGGACLFSTLGTEAARASGEARHTLTLSVRNQIEKFSRSAPGNTDDERRQAATGAWAAMIGAVMLARIVDDPALSDQLMADTKEWIDALS